MSRNDWSKYRGRRIRLERSHYSIPYQTIAITIATHRRRVVFAQHSFVDECTRELETAASARGIDVLIYCFMPDHLHLLLQPNTDSDVVEFIQRFKSWTTRRAWQLGIHGKIWQRSFHDHILRENEEPIQHMRYIVNNPVAAGLVESWWDYQYIGSFVFDLENLDW